MLSRRRGALTVDERVVRVAVVDGGREEGDGREVDAGTRMRRWAARVRGARRENKAFK